MSNVGVDKGSFESSGSGGVTRLVGPDRIGKFLGNMSGYFRNAILAAGLVLGGCVTTGPTALQKIRGVEGVGQDGNVVSCAKSNQLDTAYRIAIHRLRVMAVLQMCGAENAKSKVYGGPVREADAPTLDGYEVCVQGNLVKGRPQDLQTQIGVECETN